MCFVYIWEQTAICATYSINWLVFIIEMKSFYSAVRTGSLNKVVCVSSLKGWDHLHTAFCCHLKFSKLMTKIVNYLSHFWQLSVKGTLPFPQVLTALKTRIKPFSFILDTVRSFGEKSCQNWICFCLRCKEGVRGGAVVWGTGLQAGRSRVQFPMVSLEFFIDIIFQVALWPWGWLRL